MSILYQKIAESNSWLWYVGTDGRVFRVYNKEPYTKRKKSYASVQITRGEAQVKVNGTYYNVKKLVAKSFMRDYKPGYVVQHKDGNKLNNSIENLIITPRNKFNKKISKIGGNKKATARKVIVIDPDGNTQIYESVVDTARKLIVSRDVIKRILSKGVNNSIILKDYIIKYYE